MDFRYRMGLDKPPIEKDAKKLEGSIEVPGQKFDHFQVYVCSVGNKDQPAHIKADQTSANYFEVTACDVFGYVSADEGKYGTFDLGSTKVRGTVFARDMEVGKLSLCGTVAREMLFNRTKASDANLYAASAEVADLTDFQTDGWLDISDACFSELRLAKAGVGKGLMLSRSEVGLLDFGDEELCMPKLDISKARISFVAGAYPKVEEVEGLHTAELPAEFKEYLEKGMPARRK